LYKICWNCTGCIPSNNARGHDISPLEVVLNLYIANGKMVGM
jgi:hypothetical protein